MTRIAVLGDRDPSRFTHREVDASFRFLRNRVEIGWVPTDAGEDLTRFDGLWVAPGGPYRSDRAVFEAIGYARTAGVPFLGVSSGFQYACIELSRALCGNTGAAHAELDPGAPSPVIVPLPRPFDEQWHTVTVEEESILGDALGTDVVSAYHDCRYGLAGSHAAALAAAGVRLTAHAEEIGVEALELPDHPFFVATLFQPHVGSSGGLTHPLIRAFVRAATAYAENRRQAV